MSSDVAEWAQEPHQPACTARITNGDPETLAVDDRPQSSALCATCFPDGDIPDVVPYLVRSSRSHVLHASIESRDDIDLDWQINDVSCSELELRLLEMTEETWAAHLEAFRSLPADQTATDLPQEEWEAHLDAHLNRGDA